MGGAAVDVDVVVGVIGLDTDTDEEDDAVDEGIFPFFASRDID